MSSIDIQAKIKSGLAKAVVATGSSSSETIYLVTKTNTGTPLSPSQSTSNVVLPNAIFKSYDAGLFNDSIISGDKILVSDADNEIKVGYVIEQGSKSFIVVSVDVKAPTSDVLAYISQVRAQ